MSISKIKRKPEEAKSKVHKSGNPLTKLEAKKKAEKAKATKQTTVEKPKLFFLADFKNRVLSQTKPLKTRLVLPKLGQAIAQSIAAKTESRIEFSVVPLLVVLSAAITNRFKIQPDIDNELYVITPNLSGIVIANPGNRKSAPVSAIVSFLDLVQQHANEKYELYCEQFKIEQLKAKSNNKAVENTIQKLNAQLVNLNSQSEDIDVLQIEHLRQQIDALVNSLLPLPKRPSPKTFCLQTVTMKGCIGLAESQTAPILIYRDEMTPLLTEMYSSKYAELRRFVIEGMDGKNQYTNVTAFNNTRTKNPPIISLLGTTQPSTIAKSINNIESGKWPDDGYLDRIQLIAFPSEQEVVSPRKANLSLDSDTDNCLETFEKLLSDFYLHTSGSTDLINVTLDDDAKSNFKTYKEKIIKAQKLNTVPSSIKNKLSKYPDMILSLALIIAVLRQYEADPNSLFTLKTLIGQDLDMAWKLAMHYFSHLKKLWGVESPMMKNALKILQNINQLVDEENCFTTRDITQRNWSGIKNDNSKAKRALEVLVDEGVIKSVNDDKKTGRPSEKWQLIVKIVD